MKTILLKLAGPLQAWGTRSHFETRHTDFYPSKSAIIGLIAASLGYRRDEDEKIQRLNEIDFAVRVDQPGNLMRDYHTAHKYKANGDADRTYVTHRYYLEDAVFVVAVSHTDEAWMSEIEASLQHPYFQPFMGRRACPLPTDFFIGTSTATALESLSQLPWQAGQWYMKKAARSVDLEIYADNHLTDRDGGQLRQDRVISFSQRERKFGFRYEERLVIAIANPFSTNNTTHDAFSGIGEG
ncbi:type I-E CRISPR-associated protein Cas5/CasD [Streptococcus pluranimalium]|uniref:type I-E CRISPR-associated protein Cas5/CasD n=1 Tax=Streptococcus pluranimalium TaxID=82348 RepID=UPI00292D7982|nr:type I-E CRISPR-associated protein Cas5/CasD [Streptococcus pluranimalium]MDY3041607.1 type I-E CRISPR-associated protein Cas5/CasD [Streptococcus pluranimalium]